MQLTCYLKANQETHNGYVYTPEALAFICEQSNKSDRVLIHGRYGQSKQHLADVIGQACDFYLNGSGELKASFCPLDGVVIDENVTYYFVPMIMGYVGRGGVVKLDGLKVCYWSLVKIL